MAIKSDLLRVTFINPGPADSISWKLSVFFNHSTKASAISFGFCFKTLPAIMQTFEVIWPLSKSSVIVDEHFFSIRLNFSSSVFKNEDKNLLISSFNVSIIIWLFQDSFHL